MWLVAGLGNPGDMYAGTRHNVGFMVIDFLAGTNSIPLRTGIRTYIHGKGFIGGQDILLIKPLTFMNRSGIALREVLRKHGDVENILVIHDDIDLPTGAIRIRKGGSSGGHRGIESIIETVGTQDFIRLKIGIGRSERIPVEEYVLRDFTKRERPVIDESIKCAAEAVAMIMNRGVVAAQNIFHKARKQGTSQ